MNPETFNRLIERARANPLPEEPVEYRCSACQDTGLIEVNDGLVDGRRVSSPTVVACTSIAHTKRVEVPQSAERFS